MYIPGYTINRFLRFFDDSGIHLGQSDSAIASNTPPLLHCKLYEAPFSIIFPLDG